MSKWKKPGFEELSKLGRKEFLQVLKSNLLGKRQDYGFTDLIKAVNARRDPATIPVLITAFWKTPPNYFHKKGTVMHVLDDCGFGNRPEVVRFLEMVIKKDKNENVKRSAWNLLEGRKSKRRMFRQFVRKIGRRVGRKIRRAVRRR